MMIEGEECLIICLSTVLLGDIPALKDMTGLSTSVSPACYVRMPCKSCEMVMEDIHRSIHPSYNSITRDPALIRSIYEANCYTTGVPSVAWIRELLKQYGFVRVPEIIRLLGQPSSFNMGNDTMHAIFLGVLKTHFIFVILRLTQVEYSSNVPIPGNVWQLLSSELSKYFGHNKISSCWSFKSAKQFKTRVKAASMKEISQVSPYIFLKLGLINLDPPNTLNPKIITQWRKHVRVFTYWHLHVRVVALIRKHALTVTDVSNLHDMIESLLNYFYEDLPVELITINVHSYIHFCDQIKWLGPMRLVANNCREHIVQMLKPMYKNTSRLHREVSVYQSYLDNIFFKIIDLLKSEDTYSR